MQKRVDVHGIKKYLPDVRHRSSYRVALQLLFSYYLFRKIPGHKAIRFIDCCLHHLGFVVCLVFKNSWKGRCPR
ncbi:MAG: hypothetical protein ACLRSW_01605 [Christensenellaceae bacterium]